MSEAIPDLTLGQMLRLRAQREAARVALRQKRFGIWQPTDWAGYYARARHVGLGLRELGLQPGGHIGVLSENRIEWVLMQLGAALVRGVTVGVYPTSPANEVAYVLDHADVAICACEDQEQVDKIIEARASLPKLTRVIAFETRGLQHYDSALVIGFDAVEAAGRAAEAREAVALEALIDAQRPEDVALLIYTSGSTGRPKGAMLTCRAMRANALAGRAVYALHDASSALSYLPLCHVAEQSLTVFANIYQGMRVDFGESLRTVQADLREVAPSLFLGVPRIWEKMHADIHIKMSEARPLARWLFRTGIAACRGFADRAPAQRSLLQRAVFALFYLLVFRALQNAVGLAQAEIVLTGAAPISPEIIKFFRTIGLPLIEVYGMTETTGAVLSQRMDAARPGTVGTAMPGAEVRLAEDGEILVRGEMVFAGYYRNAAATADAIQDGWLHTGDVAEESNGQLRIIDRKKDIMITAGGKNLSPTEIEHAVKNSPYIKECIVFGDRRKYVGALVQLDEDTIGKWAEQRGIAFTSYRSLAENPQVKALVAAEVARANEALAPVSQVRRHAILAKALDHDDDELTATMKVRRANIARKYTTEVEALFA